MPKKKDFKSSAASVFFGDHPNDSAQDDAHEVKKETLAVNNLNAHEDTHEHRNNTHYVAHEVVSSAQNNSHEDESRRPIRTQGRKGAGKPRINMAFEPDIYDFIRRESERLNVGMTQYVNDVLYMHMKMHKNER